MARTQKIKRGILKKRFLGRKGQLDDFLTLFFVGICVLAVTGVFILIMFNVAKDKLEKTNNDINVKNGFFTTRMVLGQEVTPGYKVYDMLADTDMTSDAGVESFNQKFLQVLAKFYPNGKITDNWLVIVDSKCYVLGPAGVVDAKGTAFINANPIIPVPIVFSYDACEQGTIDKLPKTTVPNPNGKNMLVVFKVSNALDSKQPRVFGYRAGLLQGVSTAGTGAMASPDGTALEKIEKIPNVVCDEKDTTVGKICYAKPELIAQLRTLSNEELVPKNMKLVVTQAFRTREIQMALYKQACSEGCDCSKDDCKFARNPDKLVNPSGHLDGTAIDAIIYTSDGKKLNGEGGADQLMAENIMCSFGFVRWHEESWHFEYGSFQWGKTEEKRAEAKKTVCVY